jgi:hypothetical protein
MDKAPEEALLLVVEDVGEPEDEVGGPVVVLENEYEGNGLVVVEVVETTVEMLVLVVLVVPVVLVVMVVLVMLVGNGVVWLPVVVGR